MFLRITRSVRLVLPLLLAVTSVPLPALGITTKPPSLNARPPLRPPMLGPGSKGARCPSSAEERHQNKIIRIGVILPFFGPYEWRVQKVRPAIELARDHILLETDMLSNFTIEFEYRDSNCSETKGPLEAIDMYTTKSIDVFLGPACNYAIAPIARFSSAWGIPVLSAGGLVKDFGNKDQYALLTRLTGVYTKVGDFLLSVLKAFDYDKIGMMLHNHDDQTLGKTKCWFTIEAIFLVLQKKLDPNLVLKDVEFFDENRKVSLEDHLRSLSKKCRGESKERSKCYLCC